MSKKGDTIDMQRTLDTTTERSSSASSSASDTIMDEPRASKRPPKAAKSKSKSAPGPSRSKRPSRTPPAPPVSVASAPAPAPSAPPHVDAPPPSSAPKSRRVGDSTMYGQEQPASLREPLPSHAAPRQVPQVEPQVQPKVRQAVTTVASVASPKDGAANAPRHSESNKRAHAKDEIAFAKTVAVAEDDVSIPPTSSNLDEHDEHFFKEGELAEKAAREAARAQALRPAGVSSGEHELPDLRLLQLASPAARARRARFQKYVKVAVAVSAVLCVAAAVRVAVARAGHDAEPIARASESSYVAAASPRPEAARQELPAIQPEPAVAPAAPAVPSPEGPAAVAPSTSAAQPVVAAAQAAPVAQADTAQTAVAAPAHAEVVPAAGGAPAAAADAPSDKTAAQEKKDARVALERGKLKDAIAAGERSVALDATDGDAWLILGAAYQESGKGGDARRCFNACLKQGKKGPLGECRAMLQ